MSRLFTQDAFIRTFVFILVLSTILYFSYRPLPGLVVPSSGEYAAASEFHLLYSNEDLDQQLCKKTIDWNKNSLFHPLTTLKCPEYEEIVSIASGGRTEYHFTPLLISKRYFTLDSNHTKGIHIQGKSQQTLKNLTQNLPANNHTFVGVHVRRTDYKNYLGRKYKEEFASPTFFLNAMAYFKEKYPNPIFIFISDDPQWCVDQFANLENVFVVTDSLYKKNGAALDLAIMVSCNHTIYDYGTFGEWGAILAGGEVVCYDMIQNSKKGSLQYNNSWHLMN